MALIGEICGPCRQPALLSGSNWHGSRQPHLSTCGRLWLTWFGSLLFWGHSLKVMVRWPRGCTCPFAPQYVISGCKPEPDRDRVLQAGNLNIKPSQNIINRPCKLALVSQNISTPFVSLCLSLHWISKSHFISIISLSLYDYIGMLFSELITRNSVHSPQLEILTLYTAPIVCFMLN